LAETTNPTKFYSINQIHFIMIIYRSFIFLLALFSGFLVKGQTIQIEEKIPVDPDIKVGRLENGFTYYIRKNNKPENRFELRLAVNAGSILEDDDQQGLAHFVEHMCFNGTKHFEKNDLVKSLESMGIKFGPEINAYTSFDETVYMLSVPSDSADLIEKGFLVMEDWAHNVTFDNDEIDKERGVIIEEWRLGQGPNQRMQDKYLPIIFDGSRYGERLPIGKKDILENFDYGTLKKFYSDWYRPDLMALVVVGDIDPDLAEKKIKEHFSNLKMPENVRDRAKYNVPDHQGTRISVASDKETPVSVVRIMFKNDPLPEITGKDYLESIKFSFITGMLNRRLAELTEDANPPFVGAGLYYGNFFARSKKALQGYALVGENGIKKGLRTLLEENFRVAEHGFTSGELERFKLDLLKGMEKAYNERDKTESDKLANEYVRNFLTNEPIPGIGYEYRILKENIDKITLENVNALAAKLIKNDNNVIVVTAPEKDNLKLPDEDELLALANEVSMEKLDPYVDKLSSSELMDKLPNGGGIKSERIIVAAGATELTLSNGVTVLLKPTTFKNDEIVMTGFAWGGTSVYPDTDYYSAMHADGIVSESGVSEFSSSDLTKLLAGKSVNVAASIGQNTENISGNCRVADFETMLQLTYLKMTRPRIDGGSFQSYITKNRDLYKNLAQEPSNYFYDTLNKILAQNHPRGNYLPEENDWNKINYNRAIEIYKDRFADASGFTFIFVGALDIEQMKPLIARYLGALPSLNRKETYVDLGIRPPKGNISENIYKGKEPKSLAVLSFNKEVAYNKTDAFLFSQLGQHLTRRYLEVLREQMSGVYGINASASLYQVPYERASLRITIPCSPDNVDSLIDAAINEIKDIQQNGVKEEDLIKLREIYKRNKEKKLEENKYWLYALRNCYMYNYDFEDIESFDRMKDITSESIQRIANEYIDINNYIQVVLYPENIKK
jgi:zinc protease